MPNIWIFLKVENIFGVEFKIILIAFIDFPEIKKKQSTPRTVFARFSNHFDRDSAMKNKMKLKGTGIYMNEDLCENTLKARKDKMDQFKQSKLSGKTAFFNGKTLIIREKRINNADNNLQPCNTPARPVSELIETFTPASNESNVTTQLQHSPALNNRLRSSQT